MKGEDVVDITLWCEGVSFHGDEIGGHSAEHAFGPEGEVAGPGLVDKGALGHGFPLCDIFLDKHLVVECRCAVCEGCQQKDTQGQGVREEAEEPFFFRHGGKNRDTSYTFLYFIVLFCSQTQSILLSGNAMD